MSSFENLLKDKRSLVYEILFSLEGIAGDLVASEGSGHKNLRLNDSTLNSSISASEINLIKGLVEMATHYNRINRFVEKYSSDSNSYNRRLAQSVGELLTEYRNDLIEVEKDINRDSNYSLIKFNKFFKFSQTFEFLYEMVSEFDNEMNSYVSALDLIHKNLFSGFSQIQRSAKIIAKSTDCLYSDIWSWILFGFITKRSQNYFFIKERDNNRIEVDMTRLPPFIKTEDVSKIRQIGKTVRWYESHKSENIFDKNSELFESFYRFSKEDSIYEKSFSDWLESIRKIVSELTCNYVLNEEPLRECLTLIKNIYLTSSDNFWSNFVSLHSKCNTNGNKWSEKEIKKMFEISLRYAFNDNTIDQILSNFAINKTINGSKMSFSIDYKIPLSLNNIIKKDNLDKYNEIMGLMYKLYSSRFHLNQIWLNTIKMNGSSSNLKIKILILRHSLSFIINAFYHYFKTDVIERLFTQFIEKLEESKDIELIEKQHKTLLTEIIAQMFLKTSNIKECLTQLLELSEQFNQCLQSENAMNQLIQDFEATKVRTYNLLVTYEAYNQTNKMISNLILEIENCSKQQIILN